MRDLFDQGKKNAPCIIFIDEIDAVGRHRGAGLGGGHDEREQTLNQLLVEMDGFESNDGVILIAATNRPDVLDPGAAAARAASTGASSCPGPTSRGASASCRSTPRRCRWAAASTSTSSPAGRPGFSGADLENLVNEAALLAARADKDRVDGHDFEMAKDKVLMGPERRSMIISENDKRVTAYHEAGHALVGKMMKGSDPVHKVTIIPRGRALGLTQQLPMEDRLNLSKDGAQDQIAVAMGGRVAEELVFGQITTGRLQRHPGGDRPGPQDGVRLGHVREAGPLHFGRREEMVFLGRDFAEQKDYSEQTAIEIDSEVRRIVTENYERARKEVVAAPREAEGAGRGPAGVRDARGRRDRPAVRRQAAGSAAARRRAPSQRERQGGQERARAHLPAAPGRPGKSLSAGRGRWAVRGGIRKLFGTDGIRGVANQPPMTAEVALRLGRAVARRFTGAGRRGRIVIGKDTRLSGYMLESALEAGIVSAGADVMLVGPLPTPGHRLHHLVDAGRRRAW